MAKDPRKGKVFRELRQSLMDDLKARGLETKVYQDKVEEYMDFWLRRKELQEDIAQRGLTVVDERGRMTENRSVSLEIQASRQMLAIFTALGFKDSAARCGTGQGDEDDL